MVGKGGAGEEIQVVGKRGGGDEGCCRVSTPRLCPVGTLGCELIASARFATAYAITKALLPLRLIFSVWATPWFARVAIVPSTTAIRRLYSKKGAK